MAPVRPKKRQSSTSRVAAKSPTKTPDRSPIKKPMRITQAQKQALIDNLQIEITERARKLRAQYALQVQNLQTRIRLRVNRIPLGMRSVKVGELLEKHAQPVENEKKLVSKAPVVAVPASKPVPKTVASNATKTQPVPTNATRPKGIKRKSDAIAGEEDKENTPDPSIPNPKKRAKPTERAAPNPATVLSPKSSNSRTVPQASQRPPFGSHNPHLSRPTSPLKPASPVKAATTAFATIVGEKFRGAKALAEAARKTSKTNKTANDKPAASRTRKAAPGPAPAPAKATQQRTVSGSSNASGSSTGTTIIKRIGRAAAPKAAPVTKKPPPKPAATKAARTKAEAPPKRVLRKRAA